MKYKRFTIGFLGTLIWFAAANIFSYIRMPEYSSLDDGFVDFGWPLKMYARGGFWTHTVILWNGVIGNVLIALCASLLVGFVIAKLSVPRRLRVGT